MSDFVAYRLACSEKYNGCKKTTRYNGWLVLVRFYGLAQQSETVWSKRFCSNRSTDHYAGDDRGALDIIAVLHLGSSHFLALHHRRQRKYVKVWSTNNPAAYVWKRYVHSATKRRTSTALGRSSVTEPGQ